MIYRRTAIEILADDHLADMASPTCPPIGGGFDLPSTDWGDDTYISAATVARLWIDDHRAHDDDEGDRARIDRALATMRETQDREQRMQRSPS